jgi:hypothetical protein
MLSAIKADREETISGRRVPWPLAAFALALMAAGANAQNYPDKPIKIIVPAASGGPTDMPARLAWWCSVAAMAGVPDYGVTTFNGIAAAAGTPANIVGMLNAAMNEGLKSDEIQATIKRLGAVSTPGTPAEFTAFIAAQYAKWQAVAKDANIKVSIERPTYFCAARLPSLTILPYRARSLSISLPNSAGPIGASSAPISDTRLDRSASDRSSANARASLSTMGLGVFDGAR